MAIDTEGKAASAKCTPLQCLDCSALMATVGGRCKNYPDGIPEEKRSCLCLQHEYRLKMVKTYRIR